MNPEVIAAVIAAIAAVVAAIVAVAGQRSAHRMEAAFQARQESAAFLEQKLAKFYLPVASHLAVTSKLFHRFGAASAEERVAIEHEMRRHKSQIAQTLLDASIYLEPDAPEELVDQLLKHLVQWEIVYKLKHEPVVEGVANTLNRHATASRREVPHPHFSTRPFSGPPPRLGAAQLD